MERVWGVDVGACGCVCRVGVADCVDVAQLALELRVGLELLLPLPFLFSFSCSSLFSRWPFPCWCGPDGRGLGVHPHPTDRTPVTRIGLPVLRHEGTEGRGREGEKQARKTAKRCRERTTTSAWAVHLTSDGTETAKTWGCSEVKPRTRQQKEDTKEGCVVTRETDEQGWHV